MCLLRLDLAPSFAKATEGKDAKISLARQAVKFLAGAQNSTASGLFIAISWAKKADVTVLDELLFEPGAFYIMDRAYVDFKRLRRITDAGSFFVTRAKKGFCYRITSKRKVLPGSHVRKDQTVELLYKTARKKYPGVLRRIEFYDSEQKRHLTFLTNNFSLPPEIIAQLYKARWRVELFFKWIKQHLRIKAFFGTSDNAVRTQIWIVVIQEI